MIRNFPPKYYMIFTDSPYDKMHRNRIIAGLRIALTLLMEEYEVYVLLLQRSAILSQVPDANDEVKMKEAMAHEEDPEEVNFTPFELIEALISFGGEVITCKSSLTMCGLTKADMMEGMNLYTLHTAMMKMVDCDKVFTF